VWVIALSVFLTDWRLSGCHANVLFSSSVGLPQLACKPVIRLSPSDVGGLSERNGKYCLTASDRLGAFTSDHCCAARSHSRLGAIVL
jgi:hypothetical protein